MKAIKAVFHYIDKNIATDYSVRGEKVSIMRIGYIEFPEMLIDAQREGKLVIFAGAGVSIDPPSSLPSFKKLVDQVAGGVLARGKYESTDEFLGRLDYQGVDVHRRVHEIINRPRSMPNRLHVRLVSLFSTPDRLRVVTTNFDKHFTLAANDVFKAHIDEFYAPALPLGHQFKGIVYLHGSIERPANNLVLTDSDFGRAYLTDGWASRFLQGLFTTYTVLFVGYSHNDVLMKYISRALLPGSKERFALTLANRDKHWDSLRITRVEYTSVKGHHSHFSLQQSVEDWSRYTRMGLLEHERKIKDMVSIPPPIDLVKQDYLKNELRKVECVRFFTRYAKTPDWLRWAEENLEQFRNLFRPANQISEVSQILADWFARNFVSEEYTQEALVIIQRRGNVIGPLLWQNLAHRLAYGARLDRLTFAKWVSIILAMAHENASADTLDALLNECKFPDDREIAILLFENITSPKLILSRYFKLKEQEQTLIDMEVSIQRESHWLYESWNTFFKPNIKCMIDALLPIVESNLLQAYLLLQSIDQVHEDFDQISASRHAIEQHEQDQYRAKDYILIDAARDIIEFLSLNRFSEAGQVVQRWSTSNLPLLQRLAIHGIIETKSLNPDEKIKWLLSKNWLYRVSTKHEAFRLLKVTYLNASNEVRSELLTQAMVGPKIKQTAEDAEGGKWYAIYNVLVWLNQVDPSCEIVKEQLHKIQKDYPDFMMRDYPDLNSWSASGFYKSVSPLTAAELLGSNPEESVDFLLCYQDDEYRGPSREGLLDTLIKVTTLSYDWSIRLALALLKLKDIEIVLDVWESLLQGWKDAVLSDEQWSKLLDILNAYPELMELTESVIDLVKHGLTATESNIPFSCIPVVEILTDRLWQKTNSDTKQVYESTTDDWLIAAINHPGGQVVEIWLHILSKMRAKSLDTWDGIPTDYQARFTTVLSGQSTAASLGRVLLASQIQFLYSLDATWTEINVIPLLNWASDEKRAEQAWHGYLTWGKLNTEILPTIMPLYNQTFHGFLGRLPDELRRNFCGHLASIAIFGIEDPLKSGWLTDFLKSVDTKDRVFFASAIQLVLTSVKEEAKKNLWDRWLDRYWADRITGIPAPITSEEQKDMISWSLVLEPVFDQVVEKICSSQAPNLEHINLYHNLYEGKFATKHPAGIIKLLTHLLPAASVQFWDCEDAENIVRSLLQTSVQRTALIPICDQLARLGCPNASELGEICRSTTPPSE